MSLLLLEGFDDGLRDSRWFTDANDGTLNDPAILNARLGKSQLMERGAIMEYNLDTDADDVVSIGMWARLGQMPTIATGYFLEFREGGTIHIQLRVTVTGELAVYRGGTLIGTSDQVWINTGLAHYIEITVKIHETTGTVEIVKNGRSILSLSGIDTQNGGTPIVDNIKYLQGTSATMYHNMELCDIYVTNEVGAAPFNGRLGDLIVDTLFPNGNGNYSDFVGGDGNSVDNHLEVDEAIPDDDTTYVQSSVDGDRDSYGMEDLAFSTGSILGVIVAAFCNNGGSADNLKISARIGSTDYDGPTEAAPSGYNIVDGVWELSPATAVQWTIAEINAAEFMIVNAV